VPSPESVAAILARTDVLVLDFDGPVCSIFSGLADHVAAARMCAVLDTLGIALDTNVASANDPLEVLSFAGTCPDPAVVVAVEQELVNAETEAASLAEPTPHADEIIRTASANGRRVAILSNNSANAISAYLAQRELTDAVELIVGRPFGQPELMKPHPYPAAELLAKLAVSAADCVLVGDSVTDIEAAQGAGMASIGFANKPGKRQEMETAGATVIVEGTDGMGEILRVL
jgi:HAD superfamily hydrolase (TIGR01662 family)